MPRRITELCCIPIPFIAFLGTCLVAMAQDKSPAGVISLQSRAPDVETLPHPLFDKTKNALINLRSGDEIALNSLLSPSAQMSLWTGQVQPVGKDFFRAIMQSCTGPYLYEETPRWVQFAWVCQSTNPAALDHFLKLKNFGELSATVWFADGKIKKAMIMEPMPVPGMRFYALPPKSYKP